MRLMRDGVVLVPELLKQLKITPGRLARWLRRDFFRDSMGQMKGEMRRMQWLDLELLAKSAVSTLQQMFVKPTKRDFLMLLICLGILMEYDRAWKRRHRAKRKKGKRIEEPTDLCHPDSKHKEKELLAILDGRA
jgi:hypothetical protein